jgi:hypothetical protein
MADDAAIDADLEAHELLNQATVAEFTLANSTYTCEYNRFVNWVKDQPDLATTEKPFLTRNNVDSYFVKNIAVRPVERNSINRAVNALRWYSLNREHINGPPFLVKSPRVEKAILAQAAFVQSVGGSAKPGSDPHLGLKDILPDEARLLMMRYIYGVRHDWGPASLCFTWGMNGAIRGASNRVFTYADLNLSFGFGPEQAGRLARALLLILRSGRIHKDRQDTAQQVCCWRHIHYLLCSVFATAMQVIWKLSQNDSIDFFHTEKDKAAEWWLTPLIDWSAYGGEYCLCCELRHCFVLRILTCAA